jgi:hypothetical protein
MTYDDNPTNFTKWNDLPKFRTRAQAAKCAEAKAGTAGINYVVVYDAGGSDWTVVSESAYDDWFAGTPGFNAVETFLG